MSETLFECVIVEENIISSLNNSLVGLVIGRIVGRQARVTGIILTPPPPEDTSNLDQTKTQTFDSLDTAWIGEHAQQVLRHLPGGLSILGIFANASLDVFKSKQAPLIVSLKTVSNIVKDNKQFERLLLLIDVTTKKFNCKGYGQSFNKDRVVDVKSQTHIGKLYCFESIYQLDIPLYSEPTISFKLINESLKTTRDRLRDAMYLFDHKLYQSNEDTTVENFLAGGKIGDTIQVEILKTYQVEDVKPQSLKPIQFIGKFGGSLHLRSYVYKDEPMVAVLKAFENDLTHTVETRLQLFFDELEATTQNTTLPVKTSISIATPKRIFFTWLGNVTLCDYLSESESMDDLKERCITMLSLNSINQTISKEVSNVDSKQENHTSPSIEQKNQIANRTKETPC